MAPVIGSFQGVVLGWALTFLSLFLILLILVQRGRGGGLTGALGGPGGQSAFGTKAGDMFTKITSVTALIWIFLCAYTMWLLGAHTTPPEQTQTSSVSAPADTEIPEEQMPGGLDDLISGESDAEGEVEGDASEGPSAPASPDAAGDEAAETPAAVTEEPNAVIDEAETESAETDNP